MTFSQNTANIEPYFIKKTWSSKFVFCDSNFYHSLTYRDGCGLFAKMGSLYALTQTMDLKGRTNYSNTVT